MHNSDDNNENCIGYINYGEEDQMEICGFKKDKMKYYTINGLYVATFGLLRLFFHWFPQMKLKSTHARCNLKDAEIVLITDDYKGKYKTYFVKEVKTLSANLCAKRSDAVEKSNPDPNRSAKLKSQRLSINLTGSRKELLEVRAFWCKKLCYVWDVDTKMFVQLCGLDNGLRNDELLQFQGLDVMEQALRRITYGYNEIDVPINSIFTLLVLEALTPFYMFQVFSLIVWLAEYYYLYAIAIIVMSVFGIGSSIIQTRRNQKNLRGTVVHSVEEVTVARGENVYERIPTVDLVPGDLIIVPTHGCVVHCDAVLLRGNCIVNESMLTGESVPVTKTPLPKTGDVYDSKRDNNHTLYCGTHIIQTRCYDTENVVAVVTRTGFLTAKGQLVRSILYPPPADFKFDRDSYKFVMILAVIAFLGFIYTIVSKLSRGIETIDIVLKALDVVTIAVPPALPAAMTVGKLYALNRLRKKKIFCINSRIINVSGSIDCVCFDKTGTLTEDGLDMWGVVPIQEKTLSDPIRNVSELPNESLQLHGMAACHSISMIDGQLQGDPLDVKMFEATDWLLDESNDNLFDVPVQSCVKSKDGSVEIGLLHQFQFVSSLQRMSVITKRLGEDDCRLFCKGSPEMIVSLSSSDTVPKDIESKLKMYTEKGFRVIALATKPLKLSVDEETKDLNRADFEKDLTFLSLVVLENRVKVETLPVIRSLRNADMKIVMITGDNIETAVSVAKECEIVTSECNCVLLKIVPPTKTTDAQIIQLPLTRGKFFGNSSVVDVETDATDTLYVTNGTSWSLMRQYFPNKLPHFVRNGVVFARMSSTQKQQLIQELQALGLYVAMCGDGANDCGALKTAHVGISLSEAEASVASPFTYKETNISCVPEVIKEGRGALVTSFGVFKFMICYSLTQFTSIIILCGIDSYMSNAQFLFIDLFLALNFSSLFGLTRAWDKYLSRKPPMSSLLNFVPIASITFQMLIIILFQVIAYHHVKTYDWFEPFIFKSSRENYVQCYETYAVFCMSMFQYVTLAIVFSKGKPYRKQLYTNVFFIISILITTGVCIYVTVEPANWLINLLEFRMPPDVNFSLIIILMAFTNLLVALFFEDILIENLLNKMILPKLYKTTKEMNILKRGTTNKAFDDMEFGYSTKL